MKTWIFCLLFAVIAQAGYAATFNNVVHNTQAGNVLRVDVSFDVSPAARAYVEFVYLDGTDSIRSFTNIADSAANHTFTLLGLVAQKSYSYRPVAFDETGISYDVWRSFTTAALPPNLPSVTSVPVPNSSSTEGFIMINTLRLGIFLGGEAIVAYDRKGNTVWYQFIDSLVSGDIYQCKFGYPAANERVIISDCHELIEMGYDGTIYHRPQLQDDDTTYYFHHEVIKKSNGNYLAIAAKPIRLDFSDVGATADSLVISESILELDTAGNVVWRWDSYAQLDTNNLLETVPGNTWFSAFPTSGSWLHANSLALDVDGGLLLSLRKSSQVFKINPNNKNLMFVMGNQGTLSFPISQRFEAQHCVTALGNNRYQVFDNTGRDTVSRVAEYFLNSYNNSVTLRWEYVLPRNLFTDFLGSAYRLPNKNTLIGTGFSAAILEIDSGGQNVLLDMRVSEQHYRAYPIPSFYKAPPAINFAIADTFCTGPWQPVTLAASPASGYFSGPGVSGNTFDANVAGIGLHEIVYHYGWQTKTVRVNVGCVGIETPEGLSVDLKLYPNPSNGLVNFSYQLPFNHTANWGVMDVAGKMVAQGTAGTVAGKVDFSVVLSALDKGFYIAVLEVSGQKTFARFSLQ